MSEWISNSLFLSALITGMGVAAMAGPLGAFIVWQRMAYFGDAVSHSAILGVALSLLFHVSPVAGIFLTSLGVAALLVLMQQRRGLPVDSLLGVLAHGMLAMGVILLALQQNARVDLNNYLFGDILSVDAQDIRITAVILGLFLGLLLHYWRPLMLAAVNPEIARVEGIKLGRMRMLLAVMIACTVALSIKIIGALLITSLLILPAAAARFIARTPSAMAVYSSLIGMLSVIGGLSASFQFDLPSGPSIVLAELLLFILLMGAGMLRKRS